MIKYWVCETFAKLWFSKFTMKQECLYGIYKSWFQQVKNSTIYLSGAFTFQVNLDGDHVHTVPSDPSKAWSIGLK